MYPSSASSKRQAFLRGIRDCQTEKLSCFQGNIFPLKIVLLFRVKLKRVPATITSSKA
jgi:hypothetical protein